LYEKYSPCHPSCHHLRSEQVEVEGMDMSKVKDMDMVEEQDHPTNHRLEDEGMNMVGSNMVEVDDMNTVEVYFHPMNHRSEVESMDTVEEHFHPMNHRLNVEGIDTVDTGMGGIERLSWKWLKESPGTWCWRGTGPAMEQRGIVELVGSGRRLRNRGVQKMNPHL
jgi:hypothetical protein